MTDPIYLDFNATTPVAEEARLAMDEAARLAWGNPSSAHAHGARARRMVERAREQLAELLGAEPGDVVFTGGGTESDNAAVLGVAAALAERGRRIVLSAIEHPAIEAAVRRLERRGFTAVRVGVDGSGRIRLDELERSLAPDTVLVSVMHANHETGVIQPVREVARLARARGIAVHTDAAQSVGKIPVRVDDLGVDLLTVAGHKLYAPKGVGALYVRRGTPFEPLLVGGGQEAGRRAGTENVPGIAALGAASALALAESEERSERLLATRDRLERALGERIPGIVVHGAGAERLPNTLSVAIPGADANRLLARLDGVAASAGAACHAGGTEPSRVLLAMGIGAEAARSTLRLSTGRSTTTGEVDLAAARIAEAARSAPPPGSCA